MKKLLLGQYAKFLLACLSLLSFPPGPGLLQAQEIQDQLRVDDQGILRWRQTDQEVTGFGVNYTVPFAHAYRSARRMGIDLKAAIDQDIFQFTTLGLDLFRVHVWDCEISDTLGNLLDNEHLDLFDYLLFQLKKHHIRAVITPIAYWGNGWPEPDEKTPGFSTKYGKDNCLVNPEAIAAQKKYLFQFVRHVNPYTGLSYLEEPNILAFEICNEPHHRGQPGDVERFVHDLKQSMISAGCTKPIFYNVTHGIHLAESYLDAGIAGGTFQWYPTGLGFQQELQGNMLPNVDHYPVPFDRTMRAHQAGRLVYEFDAADMTSSYMYPAMARSFRTAGMQLATHFAYDPSFLAPFNTEYNTHFMNLLYAPRKALGLMISAEVFRRIPLCQDYGSYPDNTRFGPFHVSYEDDLAEKVTNRYFYYTNHTSTEPPFPDSLERIAGWGNSPIVQYEGTGAYFLQKIAKGMWLLEVFPDAIITDNLFGRNNQQTRSAELAYHRWPIDIHLPELNGRVFVGNLATGDTHEWMSARFEVLPGVYLITTPDVVLDEQGFEDAYHILDSLAPDRFYQFVPTATLHTDFIRTSVPPQCTEGNDIKVSCTYASPAFPDSLCLWYYEGWQAKRLRMDRVHGYEYQAMIPGAAVLEGKLPYYISAYTTGRVKSYPSGLPSKPGDWDFDYHQSYQADVVPSSSRIYLFDATTDIGRLNRTWLRDSRTLKSAERGRDYLYIKTERLLQTDPENPEGPKIADYSIRHYFGDLVEGRRADMLQKDELVIDAYTLDHGQLPLRIALVMKDGSAFGKTIYLRSSQKEYRLKWNELERVKPVILPRPYPTFLPYYSDAGKAIKPDLSQIESLQFSIGPGLRIRETNVPHAVCIGRVWME